jgi:hypothetical protein
MAMKMMKRILLMGLVVAMGACEDAAPATPPLRPAVAPAPAPTVTAKPLSISARDFSLSTVAGLVRNPDVKGVADIQGRVNDPATGINNIDSDSDGQVDYVRVTEQPTSGGVTLTFTAYPSGVCAAGESAPGCQDAVIPIATLNMSQSPSGVQVVGAYPNYVRDYASNYVTYSQPVVVHDHSLSNALLLYALLRPHPVYIAPVYTPVLYRPYAYRPISTVTSVRTTYVTRMHVAPVPVQPRPATYQPPASVAKYETKVASRYAPVSNTGSSTGSSTLRGASAGVSAFQPAAAKPAATGFGAVKPATVNAPAPAPAKSSWWNSAPSSSKPAGSVFGGGTTGSKPSSGSSWFNSGPSRSSGSSFGGGSSSFGRSSGSSFGGGFGRSSGGRR